MPVPGAPADERLRAAAELLGPCERFVDVGANHGFLGAYMLERGLCREALLTDISAKALKRAENTVRERGLEGRARLLVTDGLEGVTLKESDGVAVCGMGASTILHILRARIPCRAVLQANVQTERLRISLHETGLRIIDERLALSAGRFYVLLLTGPGQEAPYTGEEAVRGRYLSKDPLFPEYARWRLQVAQRAFSGAERGKDAEKLKKAQTEKEIWEGCIR